MVSTRTAVAVLGAGPAGLTVANLLRRAGIGCVLLERESRAFIEQRPRAGFIEEWAVRGLERRGLGEQLVAKAPRHEKFEFRFAGRRHVFRYGDVTGQRHFVYPQQLLVTDLVAQYTGAGGEAVFGVSDVRLHDLTSDSPAVTFRAGGDEHRLDCDFVAGCDGARGVSSTYLPESAVRAHHDYGIGWLALLAEAPPSADGVLFGIHPRGFAAHMARTPAVTRFYLQTAPGETEADWPDERVWRELHARLTVPGGEIIEGTLVEKRILDMHNYVVEPMSHGRLHLAGESAHLVAPIAAKGMNLALHDAFLLTDALAAYYADDPAPLAGYSAACLPLVWQYQEFSLWLSDIFHHTAAGTENPFLARIAEARMRRLLGSPAAAAAFAELYIGKNADF
ncbi:4-hydroxybenzoate 3-monooxygenase [Amycolatopsis balhimycina DSM 5908]|uniref:4-hydroxybenzoate 3-monooxygenase n=1 Tax=Amycolatopsis balhimycina DSM 5908 TaxID=1081091 RepID=A0A428W264_AMYBA|nr:4-hydroxybenzoate 3-monooxygenase [Amycolatopsis balhimycina]RSM37127.1 4-hydroxybenzoate 3-monooxygenase [Amycolatopsis balhimycina DSM 5908]